MIQRFDAYAHSRPTPTWCSSPRILLAITASVLLLSLCPAVSGARPAAVETNSVPQEALEGRWRLAAMGAGLVGAAAGVGVGYVTAETTRSLPMFALVSAVGATFGVASGVTLVGHFRDRPGSFGYAVLGTVAGTAAAMGVYGVMVGLQSPKATSTFVVYAAALCILPPLGATIGYNFGAPKHSAATSVFLPTLSPLISGQGALVGVRLDLLRGAF